MASHLSGWIRSGRCLGGTRKGFLLPEYAGQDKSFFQSEFGNVIGLQDVSFQVNRGETFVIMGLSGSGKSTMVRCLIRLIEPTAGAIVIDGDDITEMSDKELNEFRRSKIAMVFQHYGLMPHRNVAGQRRVGPGGPGSQEAGAGSPHP